MVYLIFLSDNNILPCSFLEINLEFYLINIFIQHFPYLLEHQFCEEYQYQEIECPNLTLYH